MGRKSFLGLWGALWLAGPLAAQDLDALVERGSELFHADIGCWVCHSETGEGLVGPTLHFGPTPVDIFDQLESNPIMGVIVEEMNPSDDDLVAIAMYIRTLAGLPLDAGLPEEWLAALEVVKANQAEGSSSPRRRATCRSRRWRPSPRCRRPGRGAPGKAVS